MKTYENESLFVTNFAKDCKESLKSNGQFEAEVNGITVVVTDMDNNNSSKVTVYSGSVNGVEFSGSITALKKRLNVTYTKEYNRSSEAAKTANTKVAIKSDAELQATAENENVRFINAVKTVVRIASKYAFSDLLNRDNLINIDRDGVLADGDGETVATIDCILDVLKLQRDAAKAEAERKEAERKEAAAKIEAERAELLAKIQEASANGKMSLVIELSKQLAKLK